jgi:phasin family protein
MVHSIDDMNKLGKELVDTSLKSAAAVSKGTQAIAAEATEFTRRTAETGSATLEKLLASKSLDKVIEVQADFARSSYESFVSEATRMSELLADMSRDAFKPFESVLSRAR